MQHPGCPGVTKDPLLYQTGDTSFTHQNLQKGKRYYYRVVAMDHVGNVSAGATAQARTKGTRTVTRPAPVAGELKSRGSGSDLRQSDIFISSYLTLPPSYTP